MTSRNLRDINSTTIDNSMLKNSKRRHLEVPLNVHVGQFTRRDRNIVLPAFDFGEELLNFAEKVVTSGGRDVGSSKTSENSSSSFSTSVLFSSSTVSGFWLIRERRATQKRFTSTFSQVEQLKLDISQSFEEVERTHLNCFPEFGNIRVDAVMVKQKLHCYHLSGSLPLKCAFRGSNVTWFLQTHVVLSNVPPHVESSKYNEAEVGNANSAANVINDSVELGGFMRPSSKKKPKCKRKKVKVQRFTYLRASCFLRKRKKMNVKKKPKMGDPRREPIQRSVNETKMLCQSASGADVNWSEESDTNVIAEATGETITEPASVSGIINKYFSEYDEVASGYQHGKQVNRSAEREYLKMQSKIMSHVTACQDVWGVKPSSVASREKQKELQVGNRLLRASSNLGLTPRNRRSILSLYQHIDGKSPFNKIKPTARNIAFEMVDDSG